MVIKKYFKNEYMKKKGKYKSGANTDFVFQNAMLKEQTNKIDSSKNSAIRGKCPTGINTIV